MPTIYDLDALIAENATLRATVAALTAEAEAAEELREGILKLKKVLSSDGEYRITRTDKQSMFFGDELFIGGILENIDKACEKIQLARATRQQTQGAA